MSETANARMQQRRGTSEVWASLDPVLLAGEFGLETDTGVVKIGDGVKKWSELEEIGAGAFVFESEGEAGGGGLSLPPNDDKTYVIRNGEWTPATVLLADASPTVPAVVVASPKMKFVKRTATTPSRHSTGFQCVKCFDIGGVKKFVLFGDAGMAYISTDGETWTSLSNYNRNGLYVTDAIHIPSIDCIYQSFLSSTSHYYIRLKIQSSGTAASYDQLKQFSGSTASRDQAAWIVANDRYLLMLEAVNLNGALVFDLRSDSPQKVNTVVSFTAGNKPFRSACWSEGLGKFLILDPQLSQAVHVDGETLAVQSYDINVSLARPTWVPTAEAFVALEWATAKPWLSSDGITWLPATCNLTGTEFTNAQAVLPTWIPEPGLFTLNGPGKDHSIWCTKDLNYWFPLPLGEENAHIDTIAFNGDTGRLVAMPHISTQTDKTLYTLDL